MKNFKLFLVFMLLMTGLIPAFGSSSAHFYAEKTSNTPPGAGWIYVYRGGGDNASPYDKLVLPTDEQFKTSDNRFDAGEIQVSDSKPADGYEYIDNQNQGDANTSKAYLHMYFFAKPNPGFQFDGWYDNADGTGKALGGSELHYPYPGKKYTGASTTAPSSPNQGSSKDYKNYISRWNNGTANATPPGAGEWEGAYYLRHAELLSGGGSTPVTKYAKFSIIPRHFKFVGTGFSDVTYTAAGTDVSTETVESGDITADISLSVTFLESKYNFTKWQWSVGKDGNRTDIPTTVSGGNATATYTFEAKRGYSGDMVYIWPVLTEKVDYVASVAYNNDTTSYASWNLALTAAKELSGAEIILKKDVKGIDEVQMINKDMTLNLNGHTITGSVNNMFTVSAGNFTLCDNTPSAVGKIVLEISEATTYAVTVHSGAKLIMQSGGVSATNTLETGTSRGVEIKNGGTLEMNGGNIYAQSAKNAYALINRGTATINSGNIQAHAVKRAATKGTGVTAVAFYNEGTSATIHNGTFTAAADTTTAYGIQHNVSGKTLTINNATVNVTIGTGTAGYAMYCGYGKIMVYDGKFKARYPTNASAKTSVEIQGGLYDNYGNLRACASDGFDCYELEPGSDYDAGYRFVVKGLENNPKVCKVITLSGTTYYSSLADAFSYVQAHPNDMQSIVMTAFEYNFNTANNYTVPQQTDFVVPYGAGQTGAQTEPVDIQTWANLSKYHSLTLGPGVNITVQGTFTVGGQQYGTSSSNPGPGSVVGSYAMLDMSAGGHLTIANGASLYAYGFIKGAGDQSTSGTITIQNGGTVYEDLVVNDMHGGGGTAACVNGTSGSNSYGLFPFSQYFIQNVEPRMTIEYGGVEKASYNIQSSQGGKKDMINVIGTGSDFLFQTSSGSTITKWYDATRDYQCYEVSGGMSMNGLTIDAGMASMSSSSFILPLNNNMDIHVKSGAVLNLPYALKLQAGAKLTIDEGAVVNVNNEMYIYDYQDWDKYAISYAQTFGTTTSGRQLSWHTLRDVSSAAALGNADVVVNGQLVIKGSGALYTTSHGANITSTGSGKIIFNVAGKSANKNLYECWSTYGKKSDGTALAQGETDIADGQVKVGSFNLLKTWYIYGTPIVCNPAQLKNANGTFTSTSGAAANDVYQYCDGTWTKGGCVTYYTITWKSEDGNSTLDTDEVAEGSATSFDGTAPEKAETAEYSYTFDGWTTEANGGGTFYALGSTPTATGNATYYAHFSSTPQSYTLTWSTDGDALEGDYTSGSVAYGTSITLPSTPTKPGYTFAAWTPTPAATMPAANTTYTATWTPKSYTITFDSNGGSEVASITQNYGTSVTAPANPTRQGYTFASWNPAVPSTMPVDGLTCVAQWTPNTNTAYTVKHYQQNLDGSYPSTPTETQNLTGTTDAEVTPAVKNYAGFTAPSTQTVTILADGSRAVTYNYTRNSYDLAWDANGGNPLTGDYTEGSVKFGDDVTAPNTPTRQGYTFASWSPAVSGTMPAAHTTYTATWAIDEDLEVKEDEKVIVSKDEEVTTTTVHTDAVLTVDEGKTLSTTTFIIEAISEVTDTEEAMNTAHSGSGEATGKVEADFVYFDLILNNPSSRRWNAFTVPFKVNLKKSGNPIQINGEALTLGRGYDIVYYDGAVRASEGKTANCWKYVEDEDSTLYPGTAYMIASASRAIRTVRFTKAADAPIMYDGKVSVAENNGASDGVNGGWNGIGNPMMYHAVMNAGVTLCQVHDGGEIGKDGYHTYDMDGKKLVVGKAVFVQVGSTNDDVPVVQATDQETIKPQAPRRTREQIMEDRYDIQIAANGGTPADRVLVLAEEDKEDQYVILKDLSKAGVSPVRAQMWVDRYGEKLCMNTTALINNKANYPLTISAPKAGEYDIFLNGEVKEGTTLYLTYDGKAIWNLTYGSYTASLEKGLDTHYGLRVVINRMPTGIEETTIQNGDPIRKVIVDEKVYIIRNGEIYSVTGQKTK